MFRFGNLLRFQALLRLPNYVRLAFRLLQDPRVPTTNKAALLGGIALIVSPIDLPNWIPIVGQGLDVLFIIKALDLFIKAAPRYVVQEHVAMLGLHHTFNFTA